MLDVFIQFKALVEKFFNSKIVQLFSDNSGEYRALKDFLASHGISPPHTPEHNGYSERHYRHIVETGLTLMHHAFLPKKYWPYAFATAIYLIHHQPKVNLALKSSYEGLFRRFPNLLKLKKFGCLCYP